MDVYFGSQNIEQVNGQGPDRGSQYRSIIFYQNQAQKDIIDTKIKAIEQTLGKGKVAAEVLPFEKFWEGESYHQNYERLHPSNPYIQNVSIPRLRKFQREISRFIKNKSPLILSINHKNKLTCRQFKTQGLYFLLNFPPTRQ